MKDSVEVAKELGFSIRTITNRASRLGFKKSGCFWSFTQSQINQIKNYKPIKQFQSKFYFSDDGNFIVINSRMNKYERLFE